MASGQGGRPRAREAGGAMSTTGDRAAKRQKVGENAAPFSADTDLEVVVEGEVFHVHSLVLMLASPVFRQMLSHKMSEASNRRIDLPGKEKSEFELFWKAIQPDSDIDLDVQTATCLARWADEYQLTGLKSRCERHLIANQPISLDALAQSIEVNMAKLTQHCVEHIVANMKDFEQKLADEGPKLPAEALRLLWPAICKQAGVPTDDNMPGVEHVKAMWPFVAAALKNTLKEKVAKLQALAKKWPEELSDALPALAAGIGRDYLRRKVNSCIFKGLS